MAGLMAPGKALVRSCIIAVSLLVVGFAWPSRADDQEAAVLNMERDLALVLTRDGFDAFAAQFHDDFTLWIDGREVARADYLPPVAAWRAAGNGAVSTRMIPVSVDVFGDLALSRFVLREDFIDGTSFVGRFVSLARRDNGCWKAYRSTVFTLYRGASGNAPALESTTLRGHDSPESGTSLALDLSDPSPPKCSQ